jgi:hypothetical protein
VADRPPVRHAAPRADPHGGAHPTALPLFSAAAVVGGYRWVEQRLFELTGRWAAEAPVPRVQVHLDEVSAQHGWHAELWADRLPVLDGVDHGALTRPPDAAVEAVFDALGDPSGGADLLGRLAGVHRVVLPRLLASYELHLERTVPVSDGPVARVLRLVIADDRTAAAAGLAALESLVGGAGGPPASTPTEERLESLLEAAGPRHGLVLWPAGDEPGRRA